MSEAPLASPVDLADDAVESTEFSYPERSRAFIGLRLAQYGMLFLVGVMTARALGPEGRATYIIPLTIAGACWVILHLTMNEAGGRMIGRGLMSALDTARVLSFATVVFSLVGVAAYAAAYAIGGSDLFGGADRATIWLAGATIPPTMALSYAGDLLVRLEALVDSGVGILLGGLIQAVGILGFWIAGELTPAVAVAMAVVSLTVSAIYLVTRVGRRLGPTALLPSRDLTAIRRTLAIGGPLHAGTLSLQLGSRADLLVVSWLFSEEDTGIYSLCLVLADAVFLGCRVLAELALPTQTLEAANTAMAGTKRVMALSAKIGIGIGLVTAALAPVLIPLVFGEEWEGAVVPLIALIAAAGALGIINPVRTLLVRLYVPWKLGLLALATLVANVLLTIALSELIGLTGAALASTAVFWVYAAALLVIMRGIEARVLRAEPAR